MKNIGSLMKKAQEMQSNLKKAQEDIKKLEIEGNAASGMISLVLGGDHLVKRLKIDPTLLSEEKEMLEDMIVVAFNDATRQLNEMSKSRMAEATSGLPLPPGLTL